MKQKLIIKYIIYALVGIVLGVLMQKMPQLEGQWGQNIITYMASDIGIWAVICILIASYAESSFHSGLQCFVCMTMMVASYYILVPASFMANLRWVVMAVLIFPIGIVTYWFKKKLWVALVLEVFLAINVVINFMVLADMIDKGQMIVRVGDRSVFTELTAFAIGNYILLIVLVILGMIYIPFARRKSNKNES